MNTHGLHISKDLPHRQVASLSITGREHPELFPEHVKLSIVRAARYLCTGALGHEDKQPQGSPTGSGCPDKALLMSQEHEETSAPKHKAHKGERVHQSVPTRHSLVPRLSSRPTPTLEKRLTPSQERLGLSPAPSCGDHHHRP